MVKKGRIVVNILVPEERIETAKEKIVNVLKKLQEEGIIETANGELTYEEIPETFTV